MNDFNQMLILSRYQFRNYIRARRLYILLIITFLVIALLTYAYSTFGSPEEGIKQNASFFASFAPTLVVLTSLFFGGDAIASEYQNKTGYFLFPNPIRRYVIYWGKYIASFVAGALIILLYFLFGGIYVYYHHSSVPPEYYYSLLYSLTFYAALLALTYLFSTFFKSGLVAVTIVAILYFFVFSIIDSISMIASVEPWFSITYASQIIKLVFVGDYMGDYPHSQVEHIGPQMTTTFYLPYIWEGLAIMAAYFVISAILGTLIFARTEMK